MPIQPRNQGSVFMCRNILMLFVLIVSCGCSTIRTDTTFSSKDSKAFVMVAADGLPVESKNILLKFLVDSDLYTFAFQKVDINKPSFLSEGFTVTFSPYSDELKKPAGLQTALRFAGATVSAGNYALVSSQRFGSAGSGTVTEVKCFIPAKVFSLSSGSINVLGVGNTKPSVAEDRPAVESKLVLAGYPNISAPVRRAEPVGIATFEATAREGYTAETNCGSRSGTPISLALFGRPGSEQDSKSAAEARR
jgi:hypothetical protein